MKLPIAYTWDGFPIDASEGASVSLSDGGKDLVVEVDAPFHGDPPPSGPAGPTWRLWEHEVVELFLVGPGDRYTELELGPHGHHLLLRLEGKRNITERLLPVSLEIEHTESRWRAVARVDRRTLPNDPIWGNAYAIHGVGARRRYLAYAPVPGTKPDFHRLAYFPSLTVP